VRTRPLSCSPQRDRAAVVVQREDDGFCRRRSSPPRVTVWPVWSVKVEVERELRVELLVDADVAHFRGQRLFAIREFGQIDCRAGERCE
jgi:hypothetical protein